MEINKKVSVEEFQQIVLSEVVNEMHKDKILSFYAGNGLFKVSKRYNNEEELLNWLSDRIEKSFVVQITCKFENSYVNMTLSDECCYITRTYDFSCSQDSSLTIQQFREMRQIRKEIQEQNAKEKEAKKSENKTDTDIELLEKLTVSNKKVVSENAKRIFEHKKRVAEITKKFDKIKLSDYEATYYNFDDDVIINDVTVLYELEETDFCLFDELKILKDNNDDTKIVYGKVGGARFQITSWYT